MTPEDVAVIPYIVNECDYMEPSPTHDKGNNRAIMVMKRINGVAVVATLECGKDNNAVITGWKFIKSDALDAKMTPGLHVRNVSDIANVQLYNNPARTQAIPAIRRGNLNLDEITEAKLQNFFESARTSSKNVDENGEPIAILESAKEFYKAGNIYNWYDPRYAAWNYMDKCNGDYEKALRLAKREFDSWYGIYHDMSMSLVKDSYAAYSYLLDYKRRRDYEVKAVKQEEVDAIKKAKEKLDEEYMAAIQRGDMVRAQELVNKAAIISGYSSSEDWRMEHRAPNSKTDDVSLANLIGSELVPDDFFTHPEYYTTTEAERMSAETMIRLAQEQQRNKEKKVYATVYRAVGKNDNRSEKKLRNGDWVTLSREYAIEHGESNLGNNYRIISQRVPISDLYWDGNSAAELGYDSRLNLAYKDTGNNRKLLDVITRDDRGRIIPLSKRFNERKEDIRFSLRENGELQGYPTTKAERRVAARAQIEQAAHAAAAEFGGVAHIEQRGKLPAEVVKQFGENVKGWYDNATGEMHIVPANGLHITFDIHELLLFSADIRVSF